MTAAALVLCAGIPRSGSTWLYNAARLLLAHAVGEPEVYGAWIDRYEPDRAARFHVVKVHDPDEALLWRARRALTSRRDLRDIAASAWQRGWIAHEAAAAALLDKVIAQHAFWQPRCAYEMIYERMQADRPVELARVADALEIAIEPAEVRRVSDRIDALDFEAGEGEFDETSLLHRRHIMDGRVGYAASVLPADLLRKIGERYRDWLHANGYA